MERQGLKIHMLPSFIPQAGSVYPLRARSGSVEGKRAKPLTVVTVTVVTGRDDGA